MESTSRTAFLTFDRAGADISFFAFTLPAEVARLCCARGRTDWTLDWASDRSLFFLSVQLSGEQAQSTAQHTAMPPAFQWSEATAKFGFLMYLSFMTTFSLILVAHHDKYSIFLQTKLDAQVFTVKANCNIDRIISRFQQHNKSSSIFINSSFAISVQWSTENGTVHQEFEEHMVPTPLQSNPVSCRKIGFGFHVVFISVYLDQ
jgi:hypothetical protein